MGSALAKAEHVQSFTFSHSGLLRTDPRLQPVWGLNAFVEENERGDTTDI